MSRRQTRSQAQVPNAVRDKRRKASADADVQALMEAKRLRQAEKDDIQRRFDRATIHEPMDFSFLFGLLFADFLSDLRNAGLSCIISGIGAYSTAAVREFFRTLEFTSSDKWTFRAGGQQYDVTADLIAQLLRYDRTGQRLVYFSQATNSLKTQAASFFPHVILHGKGWKLTDFRPQERLILRAICTNLIPVSHHTFAQSLAVTVLHDLVTERAIDYANLIFLRMGKCKRDETLLGYGGLIQKIYRHYGIPVASDVALRVPDESYLLNLGIALHTQHRHGRSDMVILQDPRSPDLPVATVQHKVDSSHQRIPLPNVPQQEQLPSLEAAGSSSSILQQILERVDGIAAQQELIIHEMSVIKQQQRLLGRTVRDLGRDVQVMQREMTGIGSIDEDRYEMRWLDSSTPGPSFAEDDDVFDVANILAHEVRKDPVQSSHKGSS